MWKCMCNHCTELQASERASVIAALVVRTWTQLFLMTTMAEQCATQGWCPNYIANSTCKHAPCCTARLASRPSGNPVTHRLKAVAIAEAVGV